MGMQSLPVAFGVDTAKYICAATIDVTQLGVAAYLFAGLHENLYAAILLGLVLPQVRLVGLCKADIICLSAVFCSRSISKLLCRPVQIFFQVKYFLPDPIENDVKYQASAQPFLVFGLLTTGLAIGHHTQQFIQ